MKSALALVTALWLASLATQAQPTPSPASEPMMKCHPGVFTTRDGQTWLFYQGNNDKGRTWFLSRLPVKCSGSRPRL